MNLCFLYEFTLRISEVAFSYYIGPCAHSNVTAAKKNYQSLTRETFKSLASKTAKISIFETEAEPTNADSGTSVGEYLRLGSSRPSLLRVAPSFSRSDQFFLPKCAEL